MSLYSLIKTGSPDSPGDDSTAAVGFADETVGVFLADIENNLAACRVTHSWGDIDAVGFAAVVGKVFYGEVLGTGFDT